MINRFLLRAAPGFLGIRLFKNLKAVVAVTIFVPRSREYNLINKEDICRVYNDSKPDLVIHLAANVGGIGANMACPGKFFYNNLMMGVELLEEARQRNIRKFVAIGTVCAYPKFTPVPFKEENIWNGYPEETNTPYGLAKKMLLVQSLAYRA